MNLGFNNPYLGAQADAITQQVTNNLKRNILPGISSDAIAAGGYGGSRQGIAEGNAIGQTNQGLSQSLANLYGTNYQQDVGNALQGQSIQNSYNLGLGGLANQLYLGNQGQNQNFYTQQRQLDQSGAALGANLYGQGNQGYLGQGTGIYGIGSTQQQAPWNPLVNASNVYSPYSGLGGGQTQTQSGSPFAGAIGGAVAGAQVGKNLGFGQPDTGYGSVSAYTDPYGTRYNNPSAYGG